MKKNIFSLIAILFIATVSLIGCRPYNRPTVIEVGSNQTAFVINYKDGKALNAAGQEASTEEYMTPAYLSKLEVMAKRFTLEKTWMQTGYMPWSGKYVNQQTVLVVDNAPISTRFYGDDIALASKDEVGFTIPIQISGRVEKNESALYLSNFPATVEAAKDDKKMVLNQLEAKPLTEAFQSTVKQYILARASFYFKQYNFQDCMKNALDIYGKIEKETKEFAKGFGITIITFASEGIIPDDAEIQIAIDSIAKKDILLAKEMLDKETRAIQIKKEQADADSAALIVRKNAEAKAFAENASIREKAKADSEAAAVLARTIEIQRQLTDLKIKENYSLAALEFAKNDQKLPDVITENAISLYGIDKLLPKVQE